MSERDAHTSDFIFHFIFKLHTFVIQNDLYAYVCHQKRQGERKEKKNNKIVHCAYHLFLAWLMSGRTEWQ